MYRRTFTRYMFEVGVRSLEYTHSQESILSNLPYFKNCYRRGVGAYTALLLFHDYLEEKNN